MKQFTYIIFFIFFPFLSFSQILVNEFFADNGECCFEEYGELEDFVEIINLSSEPVDIAGYYFGDLNGGTTITSDSPEITTIPSGGILVLWFDKDEDQGPLHIDAKLNNAGETIIGMNPDGDTIIEI